MNNPFIYSDNNKRYHTLAYHNRKISLGRVYKASLVLGCLCPNIDGTVGTGGCTFCEGPEPYRIPLNAQLNREIDRIKNKTHDARIIAYFQTGSNTYCDTDFLYEICCQVLEEPLVAGISIGTRADCITKKMLYLLDNLNKNTYLTVELGLQSIHDDTAKRINRCHSYDDFFNGYKSLKALGIRVCVHLINSLPGETEDMMIESAKVLGKIKPDAVKIHMLNIMEDTVMADEYAQNPFPLQSREEYVRTVVRQLEYIPPRTVIERLTGNGTKSKLIAPTWTKDKLKTLVEIDKLQVSLNSYQGKALI